MRQTVRDFDLLDAHIRVVHLRNLRQLDWFLCLVVVVLAMTGLAVLYSASQSTESSVPYYQKQAVFFAGGIVVALAVMCIDTRFLISLAPVMYLGIVSLLVAVLLVGPEIKGVQRWLVVGPFRLQPSEQTKLAVIFALTWYFTTIKHRIRQLPFFLLTFVIVGIPFLLVIKQPSLGTAVALLPIAVVMVYVAGCKWWHLAALIIAGLAAAPVAYSQLSEYQQERIMVFLSPEADPLVGGYHTMQSIITVGSGGLTGKGFMQGTQTMLKYLPEHHTDFIFSLLAEEHGFTGAAVVIGLFALFLLRGMRFALSCQDMSGALLASGVITLLAFHVFVNIAITVGLMPVTGIPLPFLSYGGSFYLTTMLCVGVLLSVPIRKQLFD